MHNDPPRSPLTGSANVVFDGKADCSLIIQGYKTLGIDVQRFFENLNEIQIYRCCDSGYRFYYPFDLAGDAQFYEELQKLPWYYMDWKWEHEIADAWLKLEDRVLEIGCGPGGFLERIQQRGIKCIGIELSKSAIAAAEKKGISVIRQDLHEHILEQQEKYDVVCSFQVLEHISSIREFIQDSIKALKPGGRLIMSVPNNDAFVFKCDDIQTLNRPPHHMGLWNTASLVSLPRFFELRLEGIEFEPLQPYHVEWSHSILRRKLVQRYGTIGEAMIRNNEQVVSNVTQLILENIPGHTMIVQYTKIESAQSQIGHVEPSQSIGF